MIYYNKSDCNGCGACVIKCPVKCIYMKADEEGFLYPVKDSRLCIDCGYCEKICPQNNPIEKRENYKERMFAVQAKDSQIVLTSSSGGVFQLLAERILQEGGGVFGAAFDKDFMVSHILVENKSDINKLKGSKYVQSNLKSTFINVYKMCEAGRSVLFVGTPCQIQGLKASLKKDYDNLFTVDLLCHGVPSPKIWEKYLNYRLQKDKKKLEDIEYINFRDKTLGWGNFHVKIKYKTDEYFQPKEKDIYYLGFSRNVFLRPSCYSCKFKNLERCSDLTIGDYWNFVDVSNRFSNKGISLIISHSQKGETFLNSIQSLSIIQCEKDDTVISNGGLYRSAYKNIDRKNVFKNIDKMEIDKLYKKYWGNNFMTRIKRLIARKM